MFTTACCDYVFPTIEKLSRHDKICEKSVEGKSQEYPKPKRNYFGHELVNEVSDNSLENFKEVVDISSESPDESTNNVTVQFKPLGIFSKQHISGQIVNVDKNVDNRIVGKHKKIPRVVSAVKRMEFYSTHIIQEGYAPTFTTKTDYVCNTCSEIFGTYFEVKSHYNNRCGKDKIKTIRLKKPSASETKTGDNEELLFHVTCQYCDKNFSTTSKVSKFS